ncbi:hypothetical protein M8C21_002281 [Ambrosia artemisiifolia]|uniref:Uncharacterized protein n=1 Tax=Ambrosia artemisiifolia TaxID=4212 RepID=A0AAD5BY48_AMBAR|nr:hypothetical protein M8C21_002281 [Ambrosia artemisiifolia]
MVDGGSVEQVASGGSVDGGGLCGGSMIRSQHKIGPIFVAHLFVTLEVALLLWLRVAKAKQEWKTNVQVGDLLPGAGAPVYLEYLTSDAISHERIKLGFVHFASGWQGKGIYASVPNLGTLCISTSFMDSRSLEREDCGYKRMIFQKMATRLPDGNKAW